jgi:A/G-specific adenine glycosylase
MLILIYMNQKLIKWSHQNYSKLPWRQSRTLYSTLVSEIMLQQTTVGTVLNHFERFMRQFPSLKHLAKASEEELLIAWKGLGYYRRAKNLKHACIEIQKKYHGIIPENFDDLIQIKGIGNYTANALLSIGANKKAIALDANLERVLSRYYGIKELKGPKLNKLIYELFAQNKICKEITKLGSRNLNEALMDLGRTYCQARKTSCELCPLQLKCMATKENNSLNYPVSNQEKKIIKYYELDLIRFVVKAKNKILVYQKQKNEWLSGQYEIPTFVLNTDDPKLKQYPKISKELIANLKLEKFIKTSITKYKIKNYFLILTKSEWQKLKLHHSIYFFVNLDDAVNLSTASYKVLSKIN